MNTHTRSLLCLVPFALLGGCATTKYQCPTPTGIACASAPDVYTATNAPGKAGLDAVAGPATDSKLHLSRATVAPVANTGTVVTPLPKPGDVVPIREQARVMRVWIAPWVDSVGNLTMASRVYTEIEPKRWSVGESTTDRAANFYPLQVDADSPAPAAKDSTVTPGAIATVPGTENTPLSQQ